MAGTRFTLKTDQLDQLHHHITGLAGMDTSTLMPRLGKDLLASTQQRFSTQRAPDGTAWQALHPRTLKHKKHNKNRILTERGFLRSNIRYQILSPKTVEIGTNLAYAATHQYGRDAIPARPFLGLSASDQQTIEKAIRAWAADLGFK